MSDPRIGRRKFIRRCVMGGCALGVGAYTARDFLSDDVGGGLRVGFHNDAPEELWKWSKEAAWAETAGELVRCVLCPHECILGENDRGFCRTRVVKNKKIYSIAYGNPCSVHIDPMEKKPMCHFLPGTPILSLATAGCNLRCLNCQNWEISQSKPEETKNMDLPPDVIIHEAARRGIPSIAYTYSEPIIFYEYVRDTALLAREKGIRNVIVTGGYINERPLREMCKFLDGAKVDLKGFNERFYKKITGSNLAPVVRCIEILQEEGVWVEVTRLVVPTVSDDLEDIRAMCRWMVRSLGPDVPLHLSRFHPAYKFPNLPPTPVDVLDQARAIALDAGIRYAYVGNVPGHPGQNTICPSCGRAVIEREGYSIRSHIRPGGFCECGQKIAGVWS